MTTTARFTLDDYDRMIEAGVFDHGQRRNLEFIRGEIREMPPIGPGHEDVVDRLNEWSHDNLPREKSRVRVQNSVGLPPVESAPEPDVVWVRRRNYSGGRPTADDVLLVIEVAESSLPYDIGEKAALYAAAGIADYWVVNLRDRSIQVFRDPGPDHYRSLQTYTGNDEVRPLTMPDAVLKPSMLWSE